MRVFILKLSALFSIVFCLCLSACSPNVSTIAEPVPSTLADSPAPPPVDGEIGTTIEYENLDGKFFPFKELILPSDFPSSDEFTDRDEWSGTVVLEDSCPALFVSLQKIEDGEDNYRLSVGESSLTVFLPSPYGIDLVDLNRSDTFYEIAVYDDGMSADPCIYLFGYRDEKVFSIGQIDAFYDADPSEIGPCGGLCRTDGNGLFVDPWYSVNFGEPYVALGYQKFDGKSLSFVSLAPSLVGKIFTVSYTIPVYFSSDQEALDDPWRVYFNPDYATRLSSGDTIEILSVDEAYSAGSYPRYYEVNKNKERGILFLLLGD